MSSNEPVLAAHDLLVASLVKSLSASSPGETPQVVQTHISTVILAGAFAFKLKKPVCLPFLDFSTLAQRRFFCEEELRINRRTAPQLYLDVLPVTGGIDAPVIGGEGDPIDWLLRMRRFAAVGEFRALAHAGQLQTVHIDELARHLGEFHQGLAPVEPVTPGEALRKDAWYWAAESLDEIAVHPLRPANCAPAEVAGLRTVLDGLFAGHSALMVQRRAAGFVRECHGDLHLGNIVVWQGQVIAFDAIEFDASLRCIDIINDVAFTFMDLHAAGLRPLAWRFINAWVECTGDYEGLLLLRLFACYRALVRANVALLNGGDLDGFARYWALAKRLAQASPPPRLVLTMGLSGSGKSTAAQFLTGQMGAVRLRSDVERKRLYGLEPTGRPAPEADIYSAGATQRTYARLVSLAETLLAGGLSVVVDAAFLRQDERGAMWQLAQRLGVPFTLVRCVAPDAALQARIVARAQGASDPSDATVEVLALQQHVQEPLPDDWAPWVREVVNDGSLKELEARTGALVVAWLAA